MNVTVIVVTKDRPGELSRCLTSIQEQTVTARCIVVDGSTTAQAIVQKFPYQYYQSAPGITKQRNLARQHVPLDTDIVIYCDDDVVFPPNTIEKVLAAFTDESIIGVTGSISGEPTFGLTKKIIGTMTGTYTIKPYGISFGLFNIINPVLKRQQVDWLPGAFMCYRWAKVKATQFDEWFAGYGLGEDFDFSYRVARVGKVVADPTIVVEHHHSSLNRDWEKFGYMRIKNRAYLRRKFWPKRLDYWLGMWWANGWLIAINAVRGIISKRYRNEFIGEIKAIFK
ncbi:MAG: hypothetical protein ACD_41C00378G0011 [uncultured bacterium]|nr:MAG: hypothetical protein ACD_41C00378G0011 [uncultured bacterium]HBY73387.1 hypothetical protein [Candidatus Kerfeldbacteria bacterium]